jgi:arylsulfatase A-like enzyme
LLFPRVCRAGVGVSWLPDAKVDNWRSSFIAHYYKELGPTPTCIALRTAEKKLVIYPRHPEWTEVFNIKKDPYEMKNLASDTALKEALQKELKERMKEISLPLTSFFPKARIQKSEVK